MTTAAKPQEHTYERPWMYPLQRDAFFNDDRYSVTAASTKSGKTVAGMAWIFERALFGGQDHNHWWVSPIHAQAKIAYRRMKRGLPVEMFEANETELTITLASGGIMWFKSGDNPDSLYGEDVHSAVIDEASRVREESFFAVRSTLTATRGPVRIIGNVKGRRGWFYNICQRAMTEPNMSYHRITAYDAVEAGVLAAEEIEDARATLPEGIFRELYLAEPTDDGGNPFGLAAIAAATAPLSTDPSVLFGVDLARAQDYTVVVGLDKRGRVSYFDRWQHVPWTETVEKIKRATGGRPVLVDSTGVGDPVLETLQRSPGSPGNYRGYKFTGPSRQQLLERLAVAIQHREISYPEGPIPTELEQFEYTYNSLGVKYAVPDGVHDDAAMALALAVWLRGTVSVSIPDDAASGAGGYASGGFYEPSMPFSFDPGRA